MTGVPASAAGGTSGARRAAAGAAAAASTAAPGKVAGTAAARSADGGAPGAGPGTPPGGRHGGTSGAAAADEAVPGEDAGLDAQDDGKTPRGAKIAAAAVNQASVWNIANLLTMLRLVLVPAFVALMLADGGYDPAWRSLAWAAFAIAMITDLFDGHLARTYNLSRTSGRSPTPSPTRRSWGRR